MLAAVGAGLVERTGGDRRNLAAGPAIRAGDVRAPGHRRLCGMARRDRPRAQPPGGRAVTLEGQKKDRRGNPPAFQEGNEFQMCAAFGCGLDCTARLSG